MIISITFPSIITRILSYKTSRANLATNSHVKVQTMNSLETQQPIFLVIKQLQFNLLNRVQVRAPHTQPSYSLLWLLTLTAYTWAKRFNRTHRKIGAYCFASQRIHLKGDVNNNNSCYPYSTGHMCLDLSSPHDAFQKRKIKRNREKNFDSLHKSKYWKVKDRPFAEGSRDL